MTTYPERSFWPLGVVFAALLAAIAFLTLDSGRPGIEVEMGPGGAHPSAGPAGATAGEDYVALAPLVPTNEEREPVVESSSSDLAPIRALAVSRTSGEPVPFLQVLAVDRNGVSLVLRADSEGRLSSSGVLALGPIALYWRPGPRPSTVTSRESALPGSLTLETIPDHHGPRTTVDHSASTVAPDRWEVPVPRLVPLRQELAGDHLVTLQVGLTVTGVDRDCSREAFLAERDSELASVDLRGATHFVQLPGHVELQEPWAWSDSQAAAFVPGRHLHAAAFKDDAILVATVKVPRVPLLGQEPLPLHFAPLALFDRIGLIATYGASLGGRIAQQLELMRGREEEALRVDHSIVGTLTSDSGSFRGPLRVRARPLSPGLGPGPDPRNSRASVEWRELPNGETVGRFELHGLDAADYSLTFHGPGATIVEPAILGVSAPAELPGIAAIVRDRLERAAVAITVAYPDGTQVPEFEAALSADYRGSEIRGSVRAPAVPPVEVFGPTAAEPVVLSEDLPKDALFTVEVTRLPGEAVRLERDDFEWLDGRWHATVRSRTP